MTRMTAPQDNPNHFLGNHSTESGQRHYAGPDFYLVGFKSMWCGEQPEILLEWAMSEINYGIPAKWQNRGQWQASAWSGLADLSRALL